MRNSREVPLTAKARDGGGKKRREPKRIGARNLHDDVVVSGGGEGAFQDQAYLDRVIEEDRKNWEAQQKKREKENKKKTKKLSSGKGVVGKKNSVSVSGLGQGKSENGKVRECFLHPIPVTRI